MNMTPYLIIAGIICVIALAATIFIGMNPEDKNYSDKKKSKNHFKLLTYIYIGTFIPAIIATVIYFIYV
ncbi:hypothetical protein [Alkalicoccus daliensis]|uniref:hypothetical protein n=1 Tax=Alkalicoccus daliensis TaxID=745820 RepID=UPI000B8175F8|nr:hypothetical protein [Alkalicoccus daliensis]